MWDAPPLKLPADLAQTSNMFAQPAAYPNRATIAHLINPAVPLQKSRMSEINLENISSSIISDKLIFGVPISTSKQKNPVYSYAAIEHTMKSIPSKEATSPLSSIHQSPPFSILFQLSMSSPQTTDGDSSDKETTQVEKQSYFDSIFNEISGNGNSEDDLDISKITLNEPFLDFHV